MTADTVEVPCVDCGHYVTLTADVAAELLRLGGVVRHGDCGAPPAPRTRTFEAAVTITRHPWPGEDSEPTVIAGFRVAVDAPSFTAAINGDLSDRFRDRWLDLAKNANLADLP